MTDMGARYIEGLEPLSGCCMPPQEEVCLLGKASKESPQETQANRHCSLNSVGH